MGEEGLIDPCIPSESALISANDQYGVFPELKTDQRSAYEPHNWSSKSWLFYQETSILSHSTLFQGMTFSICWTICTLSNVPSPPLMSVGNFWILSPTPWSQMSSLLPQLLFSLIHLCSCRVWPWGAFLLGADHFPKFSLENHVMGSSLCVEFPPNLSECVSSPHSCPGQTPHWKQRRTTPS